VRHRTADIEPMSFGGRYTLIRRLAIGGMAEIYLARQGAMAGFEKEVVIKRLRTELADDPRVVEMFLDEAKIGAELNHPNIVHVYDVDEHDGVPYIAMEYIVGEELNELCRRGIAHDRFLPLEHAVELMRQAAAGMGYFHARRGAEGTQLADQPLEIVHLDISPSNLLVTQDGFLKIIDFGIARAKGQNHRGDVLPGKISYMSPEQAARKAVDHRSDVFSLGVVLYEITVGKRLFRGNAQEVVTRLIESKIEPPTFSRRNFPPALESIVMRALEKHADDRYQSAYDLADDLESFLRDERLHSGPVRIARYLDLLTAAAGGSRRPELISEAEARQGGAGGDDLDFDAQMFDGFEPAEGAPGPAQAPEWEDAEQPEADVAAALGMELAELRALRTPVPVRPAGMPSVRGDSPLPVDASAVDDGWADDGMDGAAATSTRPEPGEESTGATNPVPRMRTEEVWSDDDADGAGAAAAAGAASNPPPTRTTGTHDKIPPPLAPVFWPRAPSAVPSPGPATTAGPRAAPRLPWILVGALGVAVLALVAYIVLT
jgi:tRNA A-37 threonylcarbamoyl transferase component Bud32